MTVQGLTVNLFQKIEDVLRLKNYSRKTIKSYIFYIKDFLFFAQKNRLSDKEEAIKQFLLNKHVGNQSPQTINLALNAIKFFYREVVKSPDKIDLKFTKRNKRLPITLSHTEIEKILSSISNNKHRLMISLAYGSGLRVS